MGRPPTTSAGCKSTLLFGGILLVGHLLCCLAFLQSLPLALVNVLCLEVGYPIATMGPSVWANDLADPTRYAVVIRRLQVIYAGGAWFLPAPRSFGDHFGGYLPAYLLFSAINAMTLAFVALAYRAGRRKA